MKDDPERGNDGRDDDGMDLYDITIRVAGWLAAATAVGMLIAFFSWLRTH